jgi:hypothetical protein
MIGTVEYAGRNGTISTHSYLTSTALHLDLSTCLTGIEREALRHNFMSVYSEPPPPPPQKKERKKI